MIDLARLSEGRRIGLYCRDPRSYGRALEILREKGIHAVVLDREPSPREAEGRFDSVLVLESDRRRGFVFGELTTLVYTRLEDELHFLIDLSVSLRGELVSRAELGVDPGRRIGIALALDGILVHREVASSPSRLIEILRSLASYVPRLEKVYVKIGDSPSSTELARSIVEEVSKYRDMEVAVQLVSEYEAERRVLAPFRTRGDLASAIRILLSKPKATLYARRRNTLV